MDPTRIEELRKELILGFREGRIDEEALKEYKQSGRSLPAEFEITDEIRLACEKASLVLSLPLSQIPINASLNMALYKKQVEESDGFYVDPKASGNTNMGIIPYKFDEANEEDPYMQHAKIAIETFNSKFENTHGKLEFVKLLNVTAEVVSGFLLYLTFDAKNLRDCKTDTYQSVVWQKCLRYDMPQPAEVLNFRLKPTPGSKKTWFWNNRCCGNTSERDQTVNELVNIDHLLTMPPKLTSLGKFCIRPDVPPLLPPVPVICSKDTMLGVPIRSKLDDCLIAAIKNSKNYEEGYLKFKQAKLSQMTNTDGEFSALILKLKEKTFTRSEADLLIDTIRSNIVGLSSRDGETVFDIAQGREKQLEDKVGDPDENKLTQKFQKSCVM